MSAVQGALLNVSGLSAAQLATEYRSQYRQCMIGADFNATEVATCSDRLNATMSWVDCTDLGWEDCEFRINNHLSQEKSTAGQEELDYRENLCDVGDCALATCGYSCTACTICRSQAEEYRDLVENIDACTANCEDEEADADIARDQSTYDAIETLMETCMGSATTQAERDTCIDDTVRAELSVSLGYEVDDITLQDYLIDAAADALMDAMSDCAASAASQTELDACLETNGKEQLAESLGLGASDVSDEMLYEFINEAALEKTTKVVDSCMDIAQTEAQRLTCVTGDDMKSVLASILGVQASDLDTGDLQEYIDDAATERAMEVIDKCVGNINTTSLNSTAQANARTQCRQVTGCNALASGLGLLSTELTTAECIEYLGGASEKQVNNKMASCVAAISTTLSESEQQQSEGSARL